MTCRSTLESGPRMPFEVLPTPCPSCPLKPLFQRLGNWGSIRSTGSGFKSGRTFFKGFSLTKAPRRSTATSRVPGPQDDRTASAHSRIGTPLTETIRSPAFSAKNSRKHPGETTTKQTGFSLAGEAKFEAARQLSQMQPTAPFATAAGQGCSTGVRGDVRSRETPPAPVPIRVPINANKHRQIPKFLRLWEITKRLRPTDILSHNIQSTIAIHAHKAIVPAAHQFCLIPIQLAQPPPNPIQKL